MRVSARARRLWHAFRLTVRQYDLMLERQGGVCAICGVHPKSRRLAVDHDHRSKRKPSRWYGRCRGLVCHRCNRFRIGLNDAASARRVRFYLESDFDGRRL
jgi:ribosomal protein L34E